MTQIHEIVPNLGALEEGRLEAESDIARGRPQLRTFGYQPNRRAEREWGRFLKKSYGVRLNRVAGCRVSDDLVWRVSGYNEQIKKEISRIYGAAAIAKMDNVREDMFRRWAAKSSNSQHTWPLSIAGPGIEKEFRRAVNRLPEGELLCGRCWKPFPLDALGHVNFFPACLIHRQEIGRHFCRRCRTWLNTIGIVAFGVLPASLLLMIWLSPYR